MASSTLIVDTLGAMLLTSLIESVFTGIVLVQSYSFFMKFGVKSIWNFTVVAVLLVMNVGLYLDNRIVEHYGSAALLGTATTFWGVQPALLGIVSGASHTWMNHRLYTLARSTPYARLFNWCCAIAQIFTVGFVGLTIYIAYANFSTKVHLLFANFASELAWAVDTGLILSLSANLVITAGTIFLLTRTKREYLDRSNRIDSALRILIESNGSASFATCATFIMFQTISRTMLFYMISQALIPKLFFNSLLLALNSRATEAEIHRDQATTIGKTRFFSKSASKNSSNPKESVVITITREEEEDIDIDEEKAIPLETMSSGRGVGALTPDELTARYLIQ